MGNNSIWSKISGMRYFIIAGEKSGDLHGSNLIRELIINDPSSEIRCWGGDLMKAAGAVLLMHYSETAFMGFTDVIRNLGKIRSLMLQCRKQIMQFRPDALILIDYPGFNLRMAEFAKKEKIPVFYYISPKLWAWNESRVKKIRKYVDKMYIIFPFEVDFYRKHNFKADYYGNPLMDEMEKKMIDSIDKEALRQSLKLDEKPVISILAGSRKSEIVQILPKMLEVIPYFKEYQFIIAGVENISDDLYNKISGNTNVRLIKGKTYELLQISDAALVASGTATLETALLNVPQVVCYRGDFISMVIAWAVIRVRYISLVNLILNGEVVRELIQYSLNKENLIKELEAILPGGNKREKVLEGYRQLRHKLGKAGASSRIAGDMVKTLSDTGKQ